MPARFGRTPGEVARLLVTACGLALVAGCVTNDSPAPTVTSSSASNGASSAAGVSPAASPETSGSPMPEPGPLAACEPIVNCPLLPGDQETDAVGSTILRFSLVSEWEAKVEPDAGMLQLRHAGDVPAFMTAFATTGAVFTNPCAYRPTAQIEPTVAGVVEWLNGHPELDVTAQEPATLGGLDGVRLEFKPMKSAPCPVTSIGPGVVMLFDLPGGGSYFIFEGDHVVAYVLEADDEVVLVTAEAIYNAGETFAGLQPILDSMEFRLE